MVKSEERECWCFCMPSYKNNTSLEHNKLKTAGIPYSFFFVTEQEKKYTPNSHTKVHLYVYITCYMDCRY